MRYLPKSPAERQEMLASIGVKSIEELFSSIPEAYRLKKPLNLPGPLSEAEVIRYFEERGAENSVGYSSFLGAGIYSHLRSVVTDAILQRGEFLTSYTPYQAEISQGTLQAIFEFQTLMCQLTGQEVANASMYDGSTATTEAVLMAERLTGRRGVLVARSLHPEYREVLRTYAKNSGLVVEEIAFGAKGNVDLGGLKSALHDDVCAVVVQSPNFFGAIEELAPLAEAAHASGALLVVAVTEALSLGLVKPPVEARHCGDGGAEFWTSAELWRAVCWRDCFARKICEADAGAIGGRDYGPERTPGICVDVGDAGTAYTAGRGDFEYLHRTRRCARWRLRCI